MKKEMSLHLWSCPPSAGILAACSGGSKSSSSSNGQNSHMFMRLSQKT